MAREYGLHRAYFVFREKALSPQGFAVDEFVDCVSILKD